MSARGAGWALGLSHPFLAWNLWGSPKPGSLSPAIQAVCLSYPSLAKQWNMNKLVFPAYWLTYPGKRLKNKGQILRRCPNSNEFFLCSNPHLKMFCVEPLLQAAREECVTAKLSFFHLFFSKKIYIYSSGGSRLSFSDKLFWIKTELQSRQTNAWEIGVISIWLLIIHNWEISCFRVWIKWDPPAFVICWADCSFWASNGQFDGSNKDSHTLFSCDCFLGTCCSRPGLRPPALVEKGVHGSGNLYTPCSGPNFSTTERSSLGVCGLGNEWR